MASESKKTVHVAIGANIVIAVAKLVGGLLAGSAAMLAEAAHSLADTMDQVFMLVSLSLGKRPPDEEHPFGYGKERFFWAFLAAVFIFVAGAAFSIVNGIHSLTSEGGEPASDTFFTVSYVVLTVAFLSDGTSWVRALRQTTQGAKEAELPLVAYVRKSKDPTVKVVLLEDSAALVGVLLATAGLFLYQTTGNHVFDAAASIAIGVLLAMIAGALGADTKGLLLGESALPQDRERIREIIENHRGVDSALQVLTMATGPNSLLVAARVHLQPDLSANDVEQIAHEIDERLRDAVPTVGQVFLDPTSRREPTPPDASEAQRQEAEGDGREQPPSTGRSEAAAAP